MHSTNEVGASVPEKTKVAGGYQTTTATSKECSSIFSRGDGESNQQLMLEALDYAASDWPVFPLLPNTKRPATEHGLKNASTDPDTIREWWTRWPNANIGIALPHDLVGVDIDVKDVDGHATMAELAGQHGGLPETLTVETTTGGRHLYFKKPPEVRVKNRAGIRPGIDVRAHGGYLVAPPSTIDGRAYQWIGQARMVDCPQWLLDVLTEEKNAPASPATAPQALQSTARDHYSQRALERATSAVLAAGEGGRNDVLNGAAYGLSRLSAAGRLDWQQVAATMERAALAAGLEPDEVRKTLESARTAGQTSPNYEGLPRQDFTGWDVDAGTGEVREPHPLARILDPCERLQAPRWLLPGFIAEGVTLIAGGHGVGKTTALLPLACGVAGIHEHGWPLAPKHWRQVIYITEDVPQAQRILAGLAWHLRTTTAAIAERVHLVEARRLDPAYLVQVGKTYSEAYSRSVAGVQLLPLVVLDTQAATIHLESENDNSEASAAIAQLKQHFAGVPVWLVAHLAKANLNRADVQSLSARGAGAWEADANATAFLVKEGDEAATRWLVLGKKRFEPRWPDMQLESHFQETMGYDAWGDPESLTLRWAIARPSEGTRQESAAKAKESQALEAEAQLRQEIRDAVQIAWQEGHPLNREGVKGKIQRKESATAACITRLLSEGWLVEIHVPSKLRTHPKRADFLVNLDTPEREAMRRGEPVPEEKAEIPASWKKPVSSMPDAQPDVAPGGEGQAA